MYSNSLFHLWCGILVTMKRPKRKMQITVYDTFTFFPKEREVYHAIFKETILNNRRCAQISFRKLEKLTGIDHNTISYQIQKLEKRRLIEVDRTQRTNIYCIITTYKELYRI